MDGTRVEDVPRAEWVIPDSENGFGVQRKENLARVMKIV